MVRIVLLLIALLWATPASAGMQFQIFAASGTVAWTPFNATTDGGVLPSHWYRADGANFQDSAGTTPAVADGDVIGLLTDYGSVVSGVTQATTDNKPVLKTSVLNGHPVWRFDGTNDYLRGSFAAVAQPFTIFVVAQLDASKIDGGDVKIVDSIDSTDRAMLYQYAQVEADAWAVYAGTRLSGAATDANTNIWTVVFNGASSQFWKNGISVAAGAAGAAGITGITIGAIYDGTASYFKGDFTELAIYLGNLSTTDKNQVNRYLATKYGISYTTIP